MLYQTKQINLPDFVTTSGATLISPEACYTMYGDFNSNNNKGKEIALIFHCFSFSSEVHTWWAKFNFNNLLDTYNIVCINSLASPHGTTCPESVNPETNKPYHRDFPEISLQDTVNFAVETLKALKINHVAIVLGCSIGGMQVIDLFLRYPQLSEKFISVAAGPPSLMSRLFKLAQVRMLEEASKGNRKSLEDALGHARFFFRLSYLTENGLEILSDKLENENGDSRLKVLESYFVGSSLKFQAQFSPYSNLVLLKLLANSEISEIKVNQINNCHQPRLILVSMKNDSVMPEKNIEMMCKELIGKGYKAEHITFDTTLGHDAFILEGDRFHEFIKSYLVK